MITKYSITTEVDAAIDGATSNTGELTVPERIDIYNAILAALDTVDPEKGRPTVKHIVSFE